MDEKSKQFLNAAYGTKMVLMLESEDHKGFHQILLSRQQFKALSDLISDFFCEKAEDDDTFGDETEHCEFRLSSWKTTDEKMLNFAQDFYLDDDL